MQFRNETEIRQHDIVIDPLHLNRVASSLLSEPAGAKRNPMPEQEEMPLNES